jgi:hypothetical protein
MTGSPQLLSSRFVFFSLLVNAALAPIFLSPSNALAEGSLLQTSHTTMVIFSDHPLDNGQWRALVTQLHREQTDVAALIPIIGSDIDIDVLQGREMTPGLILRKGVTKGISILLKGDCTLMPGPRRFVVGALGWVKQVRGRIQPFVYVECERIVEMLQPLALGMDRERRNTVMAEAITRVILHEWVHIATQQAGHGKRGITQPQFEVRDLLADDGRLIRGNK